MLKPWFQKINYEAVEGPELTWNLTAHSLVSRSGHSHVWCKQRGSYSGLMRTLMESCTLCVFSLRPRPCSLIPQASLFQCFSLLTPILHLPLEKRPSQANSRDKDFPPSHLFPERYRKRGSLQRLRPKTRWGDGKRGYRAWSIVAPLLNFSFSSFAAFQFHSLFQWDLGIALKWW